MISSDKNDNIIMGRVRRGTSKRIMKEDEIPLSDDYLEENPILGCLFKEYISLIKET